MVKNYWKYQRIAMPYASLIIVMLLLLTHLCWQNPMREKRKLKVKHKKQKEVRKNFLIIYVTLLLGPSSIPLISTCITRFYRRFGSY